jgi:hypothetical protein
MKEEEPNKQKRVKKNKLQFSNNHLSFYAAHTHTQAES